MQVYIIWNPNNRQSNARTAMSPTKQSGEYLKGTRNSLATLLTWAAAVFTPPYSSIEDETVYPNIQNEMDFPALGSLPPAKSQPVQSPSDDVNISKVSNGNYMKAITPQIQLPHHMMPVKTTQDHNSGIWCMQGLVKMLRSSDKDFVHLTQGIELASLVAPLVMESE